MTFLSFICKRLEHSWPSVPYTTTHLPVLDLSDNIGFCRSPNWLFLFVFAYFQYLILYLNLCRVIFSITLLNLITLTRCSDEMSGFQLHDLPVILDHLSHLYHVIYFQETFLPDPEDEKESDHLLFHMLSCLLKVFKICHVIKSKEYEDTLNQIWSEFTSYCFSICNGL